MNSFKTRSSKTQKILANRRTTLNESAITSQALDQTQLASSDPVTIVLSKAGWVRLLKGPR